MKRFGVTGGIGMGKSTVGNYLLRLNIPCVDTDDLAKKHVLPGSNGLKRIVQSFGCSILTDEGKLDRGQLASLVFKNPGRRKVLESILHPLIRKEWKAVLDDWQTQNRKIGFVVIPLLFENRMEDFFDRVVCIACSEQTQLMRLKERGWNSSEIRSRNLAQMSVREKMDRSDHVIWTEGAFSVTQNQVNRLLAF